MSTQSTLTVEERLSKIEVALRQLDIIDGGETQATIRVLENAMLGFLREDLAIINEEPARVTPESVRRETFELLSVYRERTRNNGYRGETAEHLDKEWPRLAYALRTAYSSRRSSPGLWMERYQDIAKEHQARAQRLGLQYW